MVLTATTLLPSHISKIGFLRTFIHHSSFTLTRTMLESQPYNCNSFISTHIDTLCKDGRLKETLAVLRDMDFRGVYLDLRTYSSILQSCTNMKALAEGKEVHAHILMSGLEENICLATSLISMYGVCQHLMDSRKVFDKICERNVFLWNAMISGYAKNNLCEQAMRLYCEMRRSGILPNNFTFPSALKGMLKLGVG